LFMFRKWLSGLGSFALRRWAGMRHVTAAWLGVAGLMVRPDSWRPTVRSVLARQILFTGLHALPLTLGVAVMLGLVVVAQAQLWLSRLGQTDLLGSMLVLVLVREVGPLLVNFIVIGRSGTAMVTEMAGMCVRGELDVLEAQGVDASVYLVLPRVVGMCLSVLVLSLFLVLIALISGFFANAALGQGSFDLSRFMAGFLSALTPKDMISFGIKTVLVGSVIGLICCLAGMRVSGLVTEIPQATTQAVVRSIKALIFISAWVSLLLYM